VRGSPHKKKSQLEKTQLKNLGWSDSLFLFQL
jgi:hypothetical protein